MDDPDVPDDASLLTQNFTIVTGGVGARYLLSDQWVVTANFGSAFRAPGLFDLFVNGSHGGVAAIQVGDPTLEPERSYNTDVTLRRRGDLIDVQASIYRNDIDNFIFPGGTGEIDDPSGQPIFQLQQDDAVLWGGDIDLRVTPSDWFEYRLTYERVEGSLERNDTEVPLLPADRIANELTVKREQAGPFQDLRLSTEFRYVFAKDAAGLLEPFGQFDAPPPPFGTGSTDDYFLWNIGAEAHWRNATVRLEVNNLLDTAYRDFLDTYKNITLSPGRDIRLTVSTSF